MESNPEPSSSTLSISRSSQSRRSRVTFESLPPIYLLSTHLDSDELHDTEDSLYDHKAKLTYDVKEAKIFIGRVQMRRRANLELRNLNLWTEEVGPSKCTLGFNVKEGKASEDGNDLKRRRINNHCYGPAEQKGSPTIEVIELEGDTTPSTQSEAGSGDERPRPKVHERKLNRSVTCPQLRSSPELKRSRTEIPDDEQEDPNIVRVIKLSWLDDCLAQDKLLPFQPYTLYKGMPAPRPFAPQKSSSLSSLPSTSPNDIFKSSSTLARSLHQTRGSAILARAKHDDTIAPFPASQSKRQNSRPSSPTSHSRRTRPNHAPPPLILRTTSTSENPPNLPNPPNWITHQIKYSCQRPTVSPNPNIDFIRQLKTIRLARSLVSDDIGVRAYSTSIAALAAYPHSLTSADEITRMPGCSAKTAALWREFHTKGYCDAAREVDTSERMQKLRLFHDVWGVGSVTARDWCDNKEWHDLDDVVEHGWHTLSREQQLGVKYFDDFLLTIPRAEVESIRDVVAAHLGRVVARRGHDPAGVRACIVGGYRRGKDESGDADVIVSHKREDATKGVLDPLVNSLHEEGWITHSLRSEHTSSRSDQSARPLKSTSSTSSSSGGSHFDTLDKAMVVWQNPHAPSSLHSPPTTPRDGTGADTNTNPHRRVDIILAPFRHIGTAVLGWTGGTTFERDLRRYAEKEKGWRFDSSGVRERASGREVDVQGAGCDGAEQAERRVFESLGLGWLEPWERCTG